MNPLVIAIGGNALLPKGMPPEAVLQKKMIEKAARVIAAIARTRTVIVTHGNGPQIGLLVSQSATGQPNASFPLDVLGAESEGMIGYMLDQQLTNLLDIDVATLLTQVVVDPADPAFDRPVKTIGARLSQPEAARLEREFGWAMVPVGDGFRRAVPSPLPKEIVEIKTIRLLIDTGALVICAGGGGIPVVVTDHGTYAGVEAVIDKDHTAALLATKTCATELLILTDIDAVYTDWGTDNARAIRRASPDHLAAIHFEVGTMGPKVNAVCEFTIQGGVAHIGALDDALDILRGDKGTTISSDVGTLDWY